MKKQKTKFKQGYYVPRNPEKCILTKESLDSKGNFFRSSWEYHAMKFFDIHPGIIQWSSEPFAISYWHPIKQKQARYFIDFFIKTKNEVKFLVEVKPKKEVSAPIMPKKQTEKSMESYKNAVETYLINQSKWEAAKKFCEEKGFKFLILTEEDLFN